MVSQSPLMVTASTTSAINRQVLKVLPDTSVADVIHKMSQGATNLRASCAIVIDDHASVIGIFTERDIVGLTASQLPTSPSLAEMPVSSVMTSPVKTFNLEEFQDIFAVLFLFRRYRIRHLPIVDAAGQLVGVVTPASIRRILKPANLLKLRRVADIMTTDVVKAPANVPVIFLAQLMAQHRVSCVVIVDTTVIEEDGEPAINPPMGIVTERDVVKFQSSGIDLHQMEAKAVMSSPLFLLDPKDSLWDAHQAMKDRQVRRLVVSWNWGRDIGIITQTSLLRVFDPIEMCSIIDSLQQTVKQLTAEASSGRAAPILMPDVATPSSATSIPNLLTSAIDCIDTAADSAQLNLFHRPHLQQASQLVQQVSEAISNEVETVIEPNLELL